MKTRAAFLSRALVAAIAWSAIPLHAASVTLPENPIAGEEFMVMSIYCRGGSPTWLLASQASVQGSSIEIEATFDGSDFSVPSCARMNAAVPGLAPGVYNASFRAGSWDRWRGIGAVTIVEGEFHEPQYLRLNGNWFDPAEAGWGLNIVQGASGRLFAAWMTYDFDWRVEEPRPMEPTWFVMPQGRWIAPNAFRGLLYKTRLPEPTTTDPNPGIGALPSGLATLTFVSRDEARFEGILVADFYAQQTVARTLRRFGF